MSEETTKQPELLEEIKAGSFSDAELVKLPVMGEPPENARGETGVWSWNEEDRECIIGEGRLKVVSYKQANKIYETGYQS